MRSLLLPESEAAAVQSRGGPAGLSEASREAAPFTGLRREATPFRRRPHPSEGGLSVASARCRAAERLRTLRRATIRLRIAGAWPVGGSGSAEMADLLGCRLLVLVALGERQRDRLHR